MICTSPFRCPKRLRLRRVTQQRLDLHVFVEAKLAPLAPVATLLVAAEGRIEINFTAIWFSGQFQGVISAHTPIGSLTMSVDPRCSSNLNSFSTSMAVSR